jgi:hypothetical protein
MLSMSFFEETFSVIITAGLSYVCALYSVSTIHIRSFGIYPVLHLFLDICMAAA